MTTWSGWEADFLSAASLPNTAKNRQFLDDWAAHAQHPNCNNNPIDLTRAEPGSSNCGAAVFGGKRTKNYTSHTWARTAFNSEIHSGNYPHLLGALRSGNPYGVKDYVPVSNDINEWGSNSFSNFYLQEMQAGGPGGIAAPKLHKGWHHLQRSLNNTFPVAVRQSHKNTAAALRALSHARKVRM